MVSILDSFIFLLRPDLLHKAALFSGESVEHITQASKEISSSLLAAVLAKGLDARVEHALLDAGLQNIHFIDALESIFSGEKSEEIHHFGTDFLKCVLDDKLNSLNRIVAASSGISERSSDVLTHMIAPVLSSFLGNKMIADDLTFSELQHEANKGKNVLLSMVPVGLAGMLELNPVFSSTSYNPLTSYGQNNVKDKTDFNLDSFTGKYSKGFLRLVIPIVAFLILSGLGWYFLMKKGKPENKNIPVASVALHVTEPSNHELGHVRLPGGTILDAYKGGMEEQMVAFLSSGEIRKMNPAQLKNKWFDFDNINYEFGSNDQITKASEVQIHNLVLILKEFGDTKIKIGAYTDKKGTDANNLKVSQARADDMKKRLTEAGVGTQVLEAEGYGSEFAKVDAAASDEERAVDRKISLRFER